MGAMKRTVQDGLPRMKCEDALDDYGYILTRVGAATAGEVQKCDGAGDAPVGVNEYDTDNRVTEVATADQYINVLNQGFAMVKVTPNANRSTAIVPGCWLQSHSDGMAMYIADEGSLAEANMPKVIGRAWETVSATTDPGGVSGGKILVELKPQYC